VHEALLTPKRLAPFRLLVLADAAALSEAQCGAIRAFVAAGGSVLATFATSLYDETGARRADFGLADLFGVSFAGKIDGPLHNSYLSLDAAPSTGRRHEVLDGLDSAPRIINGVFRIGVTAAGEFPSPVTLVPPYPDLPMEDVYPRVPHTATRELFLREVGASRVAYVPWDISRTYWDVLAPDHGRLLRNLVRWAANEPAPVEIEGPGLLDVTIWRQRTSMTVHLVNLTNPMMLKGPLREVFPIGPLRLRVRMPGGLEPRAVRLLTDGTTLPIEQSGNVLSLTVPSVGIHEVVAIDV
jgi:hypothetical protein